MNLRGTRDRSPRPGPARRPAAVGRLGAVLVAASLVAGCSILRASPDNSRRFLLTSTAEQPVEPAKLHPDVHVGLGPVTLPGYLDTQNLVRTGPGGSVDYVRGAYWAEPLGDGFRRALRYRTGARIGTPNMIAYPWYSTTRVDWKVPVDVLRFEATTDGHAVLVARWSVAPATDGAAPIAGGQFSCDETAGADAALVVDALSRCVDRLADAIAGAVLAAPAPAAPEAKRPAGKPKS